MKLKSLLFTFLSLLLLAGCTLFGPNTTTHDITLSMGESCDINLRQSGDEEGAIVIIQPLHAAVSQTYLDTVTYEVHYNYVPEASYTGMDYVKFALTSFTMVSWESEIETEGYVEINFTIEGGG